MQPLQSILPNCLSHPAGLLFHTGKVCTLIFYMCDSVALHRTACLQFIDHQKQQQQRHAQSGGVDAA
jgi:hypothetical protein